MDCKNPISVTMNYDLALLVNTTYYNICIGIMRYVLYLVYYYIIVNWVGRQMVCTLTVQCSCKSYLTWLWKMYIDIYIYLFTCCTCVTQGCSVRHLSARCCRDRETGVIEERCLNVCWLFVSVSSVLYYVFFAVAIISV